MSRINIGAKPYVMLMPVLMISSYDEKEKPCALVFDWMNKIYLSLGGKVGNAYRDGLALR